MLPVLSVFFALGLIAGPTEPPAPPRYVMAVSTEMRFANRAGGGSSSYRQELVVGKPVRWITDSTSNSCGFSAGPRREPRSAAAIGWQVDVTPLEITRDAAVVRLRWERVVELGHRPEPNPHEATVLLRPGDALPLDTVALPTVIPNCTDPVGTLVVDLRASEVVRTLTSTDLWLVHRQPDGKELAEHVNVRGKFNEPLSFYFEGVAVGEQVIDVLGEFTLRARSPETVGVVLSAERQLSRLTAANIIDGFPAPVAWQRGIGVVKEVLEVGPSDVTSFEIPLGTGDEWAAFAGHSLSLRVQSRRVR